MLSKVFSLRKYEKNKMPFFSFTVKSFPVVRYYLFTLSNKNNSYKADKAL